VPDDPIPNTVANPEDAPESLRPDPRITPGSTIEVPPMFVTQEAPPPDRAETLEQDGDETWHSRRSRPSLEIPLPTESAAEEPASLVVISHPDSTMLGSYYKIAPRDSITIGRSPDVEVSFQEVMEISRRHARISRLGDVTVLEDLGSRNGTFLNGDRIQGKANLSSGDLIAVHGVKMKFFQGGNIEQAYHEALFHLAVHDELTRIYNRRGYESEVERDFSRAKRHSRPLALIVFDIDGFKAINDRLGHLAGDAVLQQIARLVERHLRREEIFARSGGDEFLILCPEVYVAGATFLAERLRSLIASNEFDCDDGRLQVSCSFGVAGISESMQTHGDLFAAADRQLYRSKQKGGNTVSSPEG